MNKDTFIKFGLGAILGGSAMLSIPLGAAETITIENAPEKKVEERVITIQTPTTVTKRTTLADLNAQIETQEAVCTRSNAKVSEYQALRSKIIAEMGK